MSVSNMCLKSYHMTDTKSSGAYLVHLHCQVQNQCQILHCTIHTKRLTSALSGNGTEANVRIYKHMQHDVLPYLDAVYHVMCIHRVT